MKAEQISALMKTAVFFVLVPGTVAGYIPYRILARGGLWAWPELGGWHSLGAVGIVLGAAGLLWCGWDFAVTGLGTPAPFDPPKKLVARGLYRHVRNPMYVSVGTALVGEGIFFRSTALFQYFVVCLLIVNLFVFFYEEPTLRAKFGAEYEAYCKQVPRWIPRLRAR